MKKQKTIPKIIFCLMILTQLMGIVYAKEIEIEAANRVANKKILQLGKSEIIFVGSFFKLNGDNKNSVLAYIFNLQPRGYIVVAADTDIPPVIAYSFTNNIGVNNSENNVLVQLLQTDIQLRISNIPSLSKTIIDSRNKLWSQFLTEEIQLHYYQNNFQQWPPEDSTSTGGWLETNWTQDYPYNKFCPLDPVTSNRSIAGCPAVAMAQIINYLETINNTIFDDSDDYYHSFASRNYWIDNDCQANDFPSFPELNAHLDKMIYRYQNEIPINNDHKAALMFACGIAARQVYSSTISGTYGVNQAQQAYLRFNFDEIILMQANARDLYSRLSQNMKEALPAHLAVINAQGDMGHNLVVDGYNTDDYYHLNFGWGGMYNGWYLLPAEIPYNLSVIEGVIVDIKKKPTGLEDIAAVTTQSFYLKNYPNPFNPDTNIRFQIEKPDLVNLEIFNIKGQKVKTLLENEYKLAGQHILCWDGTDYHSNKVSSGIFLCKLTIGNSVQIQRMVLLR